MKLIVGLGNPGAKYNGTRHNVGYEILSELARRHASGRVKAKFQGEILEGNITGHKVIFLSPITYMNLSGRSVRPCFDFYKILKSDLLILCDDVNLPVGKIRVRPGGSAGGQKGLADIIRQMGGDDIPRLRVGVGAPPAGWDLADFVLSKFSSKDRLLMDVAIMTAADAVETWVTAGIERCMDRYNP
ncbi:MAG: aminoacyl-tRNA hydrolase [Planctomycetia bacterium]|nr:aminoacyl-tRNA hydrolase [Planctomycetia bacterium]